jgi:SAM-dependent methyltransferase
LSFTEEEKAEIERSAIEAARRTEPIAMDRAQLARYADPPRDTPFPLEYAFHLLGDVRGRTILDYGCGAGEDLVHIAARGADVVGLDISPELVDLARKRADAYNVKARYIVGSGYQTGLPSASVDIVFAIAIFHHLDLAAAKEELCRILRPAGVIIVQEPVRDSKLITWLLSVIPYRRDEISPFERPLTRVQLDRISEGFSCKSIRRFRLPFVPVAQRISSRLVRSAYVMDAWLLRTFPFLAHFATVEVRKLTRQTNFALSFDQHPARRNGF